MTPEPIGGPAEDLPDAGADRPDRPERDGGRLDTALRDLDELDAQVAEGEITPERAAVLRRSYEAAAARSLADADHPAPARASGPRREPRGWTVAYLIIGVSALVAAMVLLPAAVVDRPPGAAVTGIEATSGDPGAAPPVDPAAVSDEELEQVVADNPDVLGMRLALADRYVAAGDYGKAMRHYLTAVEQRPDDVGLLTRLAWLLLRIGQTGPALETVDRALALQPDSADAAWVRANILLDGYGDTAGATALLTGLAARPDLTPDVRAQVEELLRSLGTPGEAPR